MIRFKIDKSDTAALTFEHWGIFVVAFVCILASIVSDFLWARDYFISHLVQVLFVLMIFVVYIGFAVTMAVGMLRPPVLKVLGAYVKRHNPGRLSASLAHQNKAHFLFFPSIYWALRRWFVFTSLWIMLLSFLIFLLWERFRARFTLVIFVLVILLLYRRFRQKWIVLAIAALCGVGAWFLSEGNDDSGRIILLLLSLIGLTLAVLLRNDGIKASKGTAFYVAGALVFLQLLFGSVIIEKKFFGGSLDLPESNMILYPSENDAQRKQFSFGKWWEFISPSMSYTKSQIYDFEVSDSQGKVYFIDKEKRQVGYVKMQKRSDHLEWKKKHYGWMEQIIIGRENNLPQGALTGSIYVNYQGAPMELDSLTLAIKRQCPGPMFWQDVPMPYWWQRTIDIKALPNTEYIAEIIESTPYFYIQHPKSCKVKAIAIETGSPYQVLCSEKISTCYVSGWRTSNYLSEIKYVPQTLDLKTRGMYVGPFAMGMDFNSDHSNLLVPRPLAGTIDVIDTATFQRIRRIPSISMVRQLAYCPSMNWIFAAHFFNGNILVYDYVTGKRLGQIRIGNFIRKVYWDPNLKCLFANDNFHVYKFTISDIHAFLFDF